MACITSTCVPRENECNKHIKCIITEEKSNKTNNTVTNGQMKYWKTRGHHTCTRDRESAPSVHHHLNSAFELQYFFCPPLYSFHIRTNISCLINVAVSIRMLQQIRCSFVLCESVFTAHKDVSGFRYRRCHMHTSYWMTMKWKIYYSICHHFLFKCGSTTNFLQIGCTFCVVVKVSKIKKNRWNRMSEERHLKSSYNWRLFDNNKSMGSDEVRRA